MMSRNTWERITDCPYSARILTLIYKAGTIKRSDLRKHITGGAGTHKQALQFLEDEGYIIIEDITIPHVTSKIILTAKGERAAKHFMAIDEDLSDDDHVPSSSPAERVLTKEE